VALHFIQASTPNKVLMGDTNAKTQPNSGYCFISIDLLKDVINPACMIWAFTMLVSIGLSFSFRS
jgi:hypothetical protein